MGRETAARSRTKRTSSAPRGTADRATSAAAPDPTPQGDAQRPEGRNRVVIGGVTPEIDGGRFPIKRVVGEDVTVEADVFTDGHDEISCSLRWQRVGEDRWHEEPMEFLVNDRWTASFHVDQLGHYRYTVVGWVDRFKTWMHDFEKRVAAEQDVEIDLLIGAELVAEAAERATGGDAERLRTYVSVLRGEGPGLEGRGGQPERSRAALADELSILVARHGARRFVTTHPRELEVLVDRERARTSAWYELFPRSVGVEGRHGTLADVRERALPYVAALGFDVLYLPPIHPIGQTARKGRNNVVVAAPDDVGSPWAIGSSEGGHKAVHPELGTVEDLAALAAACRDHGLELALDIAFQCSPDHPYVTEHPEWFKHRPDGTIQYAENPPKKYQDIYPFDFETEAWVSLWEELRSVFLFWAEQGVRIFRVDNPHTKPFPFWEWCIAEVKREYPDALFLSEAFTRPKVMAQLAKLGFTQSYTYFAWRNQAWELEQYFTELTQTELVEYFRPNAWPNTPDILTEFLQYGGRPAFVMRFLLAATLASNYGIYGPAFELQVHEAARPGSEEYLDSEKYQRRDWDLDQPDSLRDLIARVNRIRRQHPALRSDRRLHFHSVDNPQLLCYSKSTPDHSDVILCIVNLDPYHTQAGWVHLELFDLGLDVGQPYQVHDLLTGARFGWQDSTNFVELNPHVVPAHVFEVRWQSRTERDFATYR